MKAKIECIPCLCSQALRVATLASEDQWSQRKVLGEVMRNLVDADLSRPPAELVVEVLQQARLKVADPFSEVRAAVQKAFEPLAREFGGLMEKTEDRLALAAVGAAAANLVDALILNPQLDMKGEFLRLLKAGFASGTIDELKAALKGADEVLYILDNAGEVLVDMHLIDEIRQLGANVRAVARSGGLLHDVTVNEAVAAGLVGVVEVEVPIDEVVSGEAPSDSRIEGPPDLFATAPGVLGLTAKPSSPTLAEVIHGVDLVISKGSANFQTFLLDGTPVVHLLRAKCGPVARKLGVKPGELVLNLIRAGDMTSAHISRPKL